MRLLKRRGDVHALPTQPRVHRLTVIRWLYIAGVLALAVWLVNFFFGGLFYLKSEGLVLSEPGIVAAEFTVTVRDAKAKAYKKVRLPRSCPHRVLPNRLPGLPPTSRRVRRDGANCASAARWSTGCLLSPKTAKISPAPRLRSWRRLRCTAISRPIKELPPSTPNTAAIRT